MKKIVFALLGVLLLTGCLKEELPIRKPAQGNGISTIEQVNIGKEYGKQIYYRFEDSTIVKVVDRNTWDLGFENKADGFHVIINNGRGGGLRKTNKKDFTKVMNDNTVDWGYDRPSWNLDSTFIGDWRGDSSIYVFYLGINPDGSALDKYKFRMLDVSDTEYRFEYCKLTETTPIQVTLTKKEGYKFSLFSFLTNRDVTTEGMPKDADYDVCFRTYTYIYPDGIPYLVVGCLLNPVQTEAKQVVEKNDFNQVNYQDAISGDYSSSVDKIGFDWKEYGFDVTYYTVYPQKNYIVKTQKDNYFKLHFLDYYDDSGLKGAPKFEFQPLNP